MGTLSLMFLKQALKVFGLTIGGMLSIFLLIEFFEVLKFAEGHGAPLLLIFKYLFFTLPRYLVFAFPLGVLLSTMVVLGVASKARELVAVQALGGSLRRATAVFILLGAFWAGTSFLFAEKIAPAATAMARHVRNAEIGGKDTEVAFNRQRMWMRSKNGAIVKINIFSGNTIKGLSVFEFNKGLKRRLEAEEAVWGGKVWILHNVRIYEFDRGSSWVTNKDVIEYEGLAKPATLGEEERTPEEMTYPELHAYTKRLQRAGFRAEKHLVNLYGKISFPLVCLSMALIGTALALRQKKGGGMRSVGMAVGVTVVYWALHMLMLSLGYSARVSPVVSAWFGPTLFLALGGVLYFRAEK